MSQNNRENNKINNNKGFSLVELLIAVTILAIISIPFLRSFVTAANINGKSRQAQRATTVAQDLMEGLKAYDFDEIYDMYTKAVDPKDPDNVAEMLLVNKNVIKGDYGVLSEPADPLNIDEPYVFYMQNLNYPSTGSYYDVKVTIDPRGYMKDPQGANIKNHDHPFNNENMAKVSGINGEYDGQFKQSTGNYGHNQEALNYYNDLLFDDESDEAKSFAELKNKGFAVTRTIDINITDSKTLDPKVKEKLTTENVNAYNGFVTYTYKCSAPSRPDIPADDLEFVCRPDASDPLKSGDPFITYSGKLFVFFYPFFGEKLGSDNELININTNGKLASDDIIQLYLVKQVLSKPDGGSESDSADPIYSDSQLYNNEMAYHTTVSCDNANALRLRTNLGFHLVNQKFIDNSHDDDGPNGELPTDNIDTPNVPTQVSYDPGSMNVYALSGRYIGTGTDPDEGKITDVIFDIQVDVYKKDGFVNGFPNEDHVAVLTGNKNN